MCPDMLELLSLSPTRLSTSSLISPWNEATTKSRPSPAYNLLVSGMSFYGVLVSVFVVSGRSHVFLRTCSYELSTVLLLAFLSLSSLACRNPKGDCTPAPPESSTGRIFSAANIAQASPLAVALLAIAAFAGRLFA
jgi:hypothetical protein